jgi:hypothetical protein
MATSNAEDKRLFRASFPNLKGARFASDPTADYNCFALAVGLDLFWWWPEFVRGDEYWPPSVSRAATAEAFLDLFRRLGYVSCRDGRRRPGFEKIALYTRDGKPTHAARQRPDGKWWSKIGERSDILHPTCHCLGSDTAPNSYGAVEFFLQRKVTPAVQILRLKRLMFDCEFLGDIVVQHNGMVKASFVRRIFGS